MIQQRTKLSISDNSGAKTARCIKILGGFKKRYAKIGDIVIVSVQTIRTKLKENSKIKIGEIYKGLVVKTKKKIYKKNNEFLSFRENSIILINKQGMPAGNRITCFLPKGLKKKKFQKIIGISHGLY